MDAAIVAATVSACVVAGVSLVTTLLNLSGGGRNAARVAHRELLGAYLARLGRDVRGVVAASTVYRTRLAQGKDPDSWRLRAERHGQDLNELRTEVRYLLFGIDDGLRSLSRVSSWIQHFRDHPHDAERMLDLANTLRDTLDATIAKSYRRGEPPTKADKRKVLRAARAIDEAWEKRMTPVALDDAEAPSGDSD